MSRRMTRYLDDPFVATLTEEIRKAQKLLTRLRAKRSHAVANLRSKGRYRNNAEYRERHKRMALKHYYEVVRPKLRPHLCGGSR